MAEITIEIGGQEETYSSKKEMLVSVGYAILDDADSAMTLRQLYYRFVAFDLIENKRSQYQYLGEAVKEARLDGTIPWDWIEDRTRGTDGGDWDYVKPQNRFQRALNWFKKTPKRHNRPRWEGQDDYIEVWVEKEALAGVFADVCEDLRVTTFPNRGYSSITLLKEAADRFKEAARDGKNPVILYFGDYDPSGQDIERNIDEKMNETFGVDVHVDRKALTRKQIDKFQLPPQPAKSSDARYEQFVEEHGNIAVELDALPPEELKELIRESVEEYFDEDHYESNVLPEQKEERATIREEVEEALVDGI